MVELCYDRVQRGPLRPTLELVPVHVTNVPPLDGTEADVLARFANYIDAELAVRGHSRLTHRVVFVLDLIQLERLCAATPPAEAKVPSRHHADVLGITYLRYLIEHGLRFVWGPEYIRRAREDFPVDLE